MKIEPGDIVTYKSEGFLGGTQYQGVVESVDGDVVDLGIDGAVNREQIVSVDGKSPSVSL